MRVGKDHPCTFHRAQVGVEGVPKVPIELDQAGLRKQKNRICLSIYHRRNLGQGMGSIDDEGAKSQTE